MKISFVLVDELAVRKLKDDLALRNLGADVINANTSFFPQFPDRGFFKRFATLDAATRGCPIDRARECARPMLEAKQQDSSKRVGDQ